MTTTTEYTADSGKTFSRISDGQIMGHILIMGVNDSIDNYEEVELTEDNDIEGLLKIETLIQHRRYGKL